MLGRTCMSVHVQRNAAKQRAMCQAGHSVDISPSPPLGRPQCARHCEPAPRPACAQSGPWRRCWRPSTRARPETAPASSRYRGRALHLQTSIGPIHGWVRPRAHVARVACAGVACYVPIPEGAVFVCCERRTTVFCRGDGNSSRRRRDALLERVSAWHRRKTVHQSQLSYFLASPLIATRAFRVPPYRGGGAPRVWVPRKDH